jgi:glutaminyl-peptide cyclotransferase
MRARLFTVPVLLALGLACQSSPPPAARVPAPPAERAEAFEAQRAWEHLSTLAEIGPRVMGTEGVRRAGDYILDELAKLDIEPIEQEITARRGEQDEEPLALRNIAAKIPGRSSDVFLLVAPYDTRRYESFRFLGVNDGGSGAALLLEIARVLAADPLPYTTWLVFLDGEAPLAPGSVPVASPSHFGSRALANQLHEEGVLAGVRLALVLNRVCDADLRVARDLLSHRIYREEFWRAAARLGRSDAFPPGASFESPVASHYALAAVGLRRVVALVDTSFGGDEPPGLYAGTEDDDLEHCSADSLEAVGKVALEALDKISQRLAKIDRFAKSPLEGTSELTFELPGASEADDAATPQTGDDTATPSAREGNEELTEATPEAPEAPR